MLHVTRDSVGLAFGLAEGHLRAGNEKEAEGICRRILEVEPGHAGARHVLGVSLCGRGEWEEARGIWGSIVESNPADAEGWFYLGRSWYGVGKDRKSGV